MRRFRDERPADICFARGTFNSHPYVMAAMHEFLRHLETPQVRAVYRDLDQVWNERARRLNQRLRKRRRFRCRWRTCPRSGPSATPIPRATIGCCNIICVPKDLALSWVGTGRLIFSLNYSDDDFAAVADRFVTAARAMQDDGWWWCDAATTNKSIRRRILKEMIAHRFWSRRAIT